MQDRERLNILMGVWGMSTTWTMASRLLELPSEQIPVQGLESMAVAQRLDLAAAKERIVVAAQSLALARAVRFIPDANIGVHSEREPDGLNTIGPGIAFPLPLFDQGQPVLGRGGALLAQAQLRFAALAVEIRSNVRAQYSRMIAARDRATYYRRSVLPLAGEIVDQTQLQYNAMQTGVIQLLQAKQAQIDAGREYIDTLREYWVARSQLERTLGGRLKGAEPATPATQPASMPATNESQPQRQH